MCARFRKVRLQTVGMSVVLLITVAALKGNAQSAPEDQSRAQQTQIRGFWIDPSTGLMWAGKDNGKDVSWKGALKYCRDLRLAGYSDWRLANMFELQPLYDKTANAPGRAGDTKGGNPRDFTWHVKGNLFLTGDEWSSRADGKEKSGGYEYYFDFNEGKSNDDPVGWPYPFSGRRAFRRSLGRPAAASLARSWAVLWPLFRCGAKARCSASG